MSKMKLTIQHNNTLFEPPVEEGVKIEWERTGSPGKLTFTTIKVPTGGMSFTEGDQVCFYYDNKPMFKGYVFSKKRDRENHIQVTCYDQIRYLKNKYTYGWENKTAAQIIKALCADFNLKVGTMDNTSYVIPSVLEENKAALDIVLKVLEETLLNTGNMFVLYDDFGNLTVKNCANMKSSTLIYNETAENFDYSSSIDTETYNQVVLYYKQDDQIVQLYTAQSPTTIKQWGVLRYFEEVDTPTIGQNKANALLKLYNKKTRELKITGAFGDPTVRGGTLIPVQLNLGDAITNNFMLVEKVVHNFDHSHYTMDLTVAGEWNDGYAAIVSKTVGTLDSETATKTTTSSTGSAKPRTLTVNHSFNTYTGKITIQYVLNGKTITQDASASRYTQVTCDGNTNAIVAITNKDGGQSSTSVVKGKWSPGRSNRYEFYMSENAEIIVNWKPKIDGMSRGD